MTKRFFVLALIPVFLTACMRPATVANSPQPMNCTAEKDAIDAVVGQFERYQLGTDARGALGLFVEPVTDKDQQAYDQLIGKMDGEPGLYNTVLTQINLTGYTITGEPKTVANGCLVTVEEQRNPASNANPKASASQTVTANVVLGKQGDSWKIQQYYLTTQSPSLYGGWGY